MAHLPENEALVNPKFGRRTWIKLWVNEWLDGTTRFEMTDVQRALWTDLLAMAGRSRFPGVVCAGMINGKYVGYPLTKFQSLLAEPIDIEETLHLYERTSKIKLTVTHENPVKLYALELLNWDKYQSEYQRQKKYRKPRLQESDSKSYTQSNKTEVEVEVEVEKKKNKSKSFVVPTLKEVSDYCIERLNGIDPQHFIDWNTVRGWKTRQGPIRDWKACIRTWEQNRKTNHQQPTSFQPSAPEGMTDEEIAYAKSWNRKERERIAAKTR